MYDNNGNVQLLMLFFFVKKLKTTGCMIAWVKDSRLRAEGGYLYRSIFDYQ